MRVHKSKILHVALMLLIAFVPMMLIVDPYSLYLVVGSILFATALAALHSYWPAMVIAITASIEDMSRADILTAAFMLLLFATAMREAYVTFWLEFFPFQERRPDSYYAVLAFLRYTAVTAALFFICSRKPLNDGSLVSQIPGWPRGVIGVVVGIAIGLAMIYR